MFSGDTSLRVIESECRAPVPNTIKCMTWEHHICLVLQYRTPWVKSGMGGLKCTEPECVSVQHWKVCRGVPLVSSPNIQWPFPLHPDLSFSSLSKSCPVQSRKTMILCHFPKLSSWHPKQKKSFQNPDRPIQLRSEHICLLLSYFPFETLF